MYHYTDLEFEAAVKASISVRQALRHLGLRPCGGNYSTFRRKVIELDIDTAHFKGQSHRKGHRYTHKPLAEYLEVGSKIHSYKLKSRLFQEKIKEPCCENCGITEWNGQPAPLELDHINGRHDDNRLENLRILCPNCHAQTSTYRGKNKGTYSLA